MTSTRPRIAVLTFVYEGDNELATDLFESIIRSCPAVDIDFYFTDDASDSRLGDALVTWCRDRGFTACCVRYDTRMGYRGAIHRTLSLLGHVARSDSRYEFVLRIDTDALVIREGLAASLLQYCGDPQAVYGVERTMRTRDRVALLLDLLPVGLQRRTRDGMVERAYSPTRRAPVWWWRIGVKALARGFRFRFPDGCCYVLGGQLPAVLLESGLLDAYRPERYGLITSEEDVILAMMCRSIGATVHNLVDHDPTWSQMSWIGSKVLDAQPDTLPFVVHPLKATSDDLTLRAQIHAQLPLFA